MKLRKWYRLNRDKAIIFPLATHQKTQKKDQWKCISLFRLTNKTKPTVLLWNLDSHNKKGKTTTTVTHAKIAINSKMQFFRCIFTNIQVRVQSLRFILNHFIFTVDLSSSSFLHHWLLLHFHAAEKVGNKWGKWYKHEFCGYSSS